jgi:hypothetical protein
MKKLLCFSLVLLFGCHSNPDKDNTKSWAKLINNIPHLTFPLKMDDTTYLNYDKWGKEYDTNVVLEYKLIDAYRDTLYTKFSFTRIDYYKCAPIGYYICYGKLFLIYKAFTTGAGAGNPVVTLAIFDTNSKLLNGTDLLTAPIRADPIEPYKGILLNHLVISDSTHYSTYEMIPSWPNSDSVNHAITLSELIEKRYDYTITEQFHFNNTDVHDSILYENRDVK